MKKKVVSIVLNNYTQDSRVIRETTSLYNAGYDVTVIALWDENLMEEEIINNINIIRIKLKTANIPRIRFIKYFIVNLELIFKVIRNHQNADIYHCNDIDALLLGVVIKKYFNKKCKIVYDAHEYETERRTLKGIRKNIEKILERKYLKYVDSVITVSNSIADEYVRLYKLEKPALVLNTPNYSNPVNSDIFRKTLNIRKKQSIFLYQGSLMKGRGIEILIEIFKKSYDDKVIIFMGSGALIENIRIAASSTKNIYFHEAVNPNRLLEYTASADFGFSIIEDICLSYRFSLPNKLFEYLMAEVPVIVSNLYEMKKFVESNNVGIVSELTEASLKSKIDEALKLDKDIFKENIKKVKRIYNWEQQEKVLLNVYNNIS